MPARPRVIFVYTSAHSGAGSKIMRVDQLASAADNLIGARWDFATLQLPRFNRPRRLRQTATHMEGAITIFLKGAFARADKELQERWSAAARAVAIDYIDANIDQTIEAPVAMHIAASRAGQRALRRHLGPEAAIGLVDHHWDPRLDGSDGPARTFSLGYFGDPLNAVITEGAAARLADPSPALPDFSADTFARMKRTAMHYGVRDMASDERRTVFKPFTKGFNAAAAGACIFVNRQVDDAVEFLGDDYPFLIDDTDKNSIDQGLAAAEKAFSTQEWAEALDRMRSVRERTSLNSSVSQLERLVTELADS